MDNITFDDFMKLDLRVAEIKACEDVPGADKLYKLTIDMGQERTIVAGIKLHYTKEELLGKKIAVVANLEPRKLGASNPMACFSQHPAKTSLQWFC